MGRNGHATGRVRILNKKVVYKTGANMSMPAVFPQIFRPVKCFDITANRN
jgi:hypothetical protein